MTNHPIAEQDSLEPCPFCGSAARIVGGFKHWWVSCTHFGVCIANRPDTAAFSCENKDDAIRLWNTRPEADTLSQMRDALGDALDLIDELYRKYDVELDAEDVAFAQKSRTVFLTTTKIEKDAPITESDCILHHIERPAQ